MNRKERTKLAYVCNLNRENRIFFDETLKLLQDLSNFYQVSPILKHKIPLNEFEVLSSEEFLKNFQKFERILYVYDGYVDWEYIFSLLEKVPGVIFFKSFKPNNSMTDYSIKKEIPNYLLEEAYYSYGWSGLLKIQRNSQDFLKKYPLVAFMINNSLGVILTSERELEFLRSFFSIINKEKFRILSECQDLQETGHLLNQFIEDFYERNCLPEFLSKVSTTLRKDEELKKLARLLKKNFLPIVRNKTLWVDISALSFDDRGTGIQRVIKAQLIELVENPPDGFKIEPIRHSTEKRGVFFKYARSYTKSFLKIDIKNFLPDAEVVFRRGDIYYCPDLFVRGVIESYQRGLYDKIRLSGVKIVFLLYDLLPIEFPEYFPAGVYARHAEYVRTLLKVADLIICISSATANALENFARQERLYREDLKIKILHLGSEIKKAKHKEGISNNDLEILKKLSQNPYFLMVSTLEPRKGHFQTIKAFEILWNKGYQVNLVMVGKEGWMVGDLIKYLKGHRELNQRLFWLGHVSDDLLERLYRGALATIMASEGEGFGLAIIESAHYGTPVIARDLPVFREVAQEGAFYFPNTRDPKDLALFLEKWLSLYQENKHPKPQGIRPFTWKEHTEKLKEILLELAHEV